jgi:hypothetical protein
LSTEPSTVARESCDSGICKKDGAVVTLNKSLVEDDEELLALLSLGEELTVAFEVEEELEVVEELLVLGEALAGCA